MTGEPAGFLTRLVAYIIDAIIAGIIEGIFFGIGFALNPQMRRLFITRPGQPPTRLPAQALSFQQQGTFIIFVLVGLVLAILYFAVLWSSSGQTLGKKIMGLKVVGKNGRPPGFFRALFRYLIGYPVSNFIFCLGFLWIIWDEKKQGWHDKIFDTYVVKA